MHSPDERLNVARNHIGNARVQLTRLPETNGTRAALALVDRGLHELALLPSFPPKQRGEAEIFFEGATLEAAVETIIAAILPDHDVNNETVEAAVAEMVGRFSDNELAFLSGQCESEDPLTGRVSQTGLPAGRRRGRLAPDPADPATDPDPA